MDHLSNLPIDMFMELITYLPFKDVIKICTSNSKLHNYCTNITYNNRWKNLIDNTFGNIYRYEEKLERVRNKLNLAGNEYNYILYVNLIKELDPITQLMIYYRQGDTQSFEDPKYNNTRRMLALFLLGKKGEELRKYPAKGYKTFISMTKDGYYSQDVLNRMMLKYAEEGNIAGIKFFLDRGADIHTKDEDSLIRAGGYYKWDVVRYLIERNANVHARNDAIFTSAVVFGDLALIEYLIEKGIKPNCGNLGIASSMGRLNIVKYLVETHNIDVNCNNGGPLRWASKIGHLDVVKYLIDNGAIIKHEFVKLASERSGEKNIKTYKYLYDRYYSD